MSSERLSAIILALLVAVACSKAAAPVPECPADARFAQDVVDPARQFDFAVARLPKRGEPTQTALDRLDPSGPATRWTLLKPISLSIGTRTFPVDSTFSFFQDTVVEASAPGVQGYDVTEYLYLYLFSYQGHIQDYYIVNKVRDLGSPDWRYGIHQSRPIALAGGYPGAGRVTDAYWMQRTPYDRFRYAAWRGDADRQYLWGLKAAGKLCGTP